MSEKKMNLVFRISFAICVFLYLFSFSLPLFIVYISRIPLSQEVSTEGLNGILTISAIIFGFLGIYAGEIKGLALKRWIVILLIFSIQITMFMLVGLDYFSALIHFGHPTITTLTLAYIILLLNIFSWFSFRLLRVYWDEESS